MNYGKLRWQDEMQAERFWLGNKSALSMCCAVVVRVLKFSFCLSLDGICPLLCDKANFKTFYVLFKKECVINITILP